MPSDLIRPPAINPRQWRPLFDAVYEMNVARDHADFLHAVAHGLVRLIPADHYSIHVLDRATKRLEFVMLPGMMFNPREIDYHKAHSENHPVVAYYARTGDKRARRITDILSTAQWRAGEHYRHTTARLGFAYQLSLPIEVNATTIAAATFSRRRGNFTRRHCALLDAFSPHFRLAWLKHRDPWAREAKPRASDRERWRRFGLTPRESDVLYWVTEGKQNREIAMILGRSLETVQEHVGNILLKFQAENRHALTVLALRDRRPGSGSPAG